MSTKTKVKKYVIELIIYGVVVVFSAALLTMSKHYKPTSYHINGSLKYAMISVPVPVDSKMEGQTIEYKVACTMKKNTLECDEAS